MGAPAFEEAVAHHKGGRKDVAERLYRQVLAQDPNHAGASYLLGVLAMEAGGVEAAAEHFARATSVEPDRAAYHSNLGEALRRLGRRDAAVQAFARAIAIDPGLVAPHHNLGLLLADAGEVDGAIACFEQVKRLAPKLAGVDERLAALRPRSRAVAAGQGASCDERPPLEQARVLRRQGKAHEALAFLERAIAARPRDSHLYGEMGNVLLVDLNRPDDAVAGYEAALAIEPTFAEAQTNLGQALARSGAVREATAAFRKAVDARPEDPRIASGLVYHAHFDPDFDARGVLALARDWDRRHGRPLASEARPHANDRDPERRLRVGYVSPDFRHHCQALFLFPLLTHHDRERLEVYAYSDVTTPDAWSAQLLGRVDCARSIAAMSDGDVAACVRDDRIDVLVDLTMHMGKNRLCVFARKPAPVQICWLAYPGTTGLSAMDYRVTDPYLDPPGGDASVYAERSLWLEDTFWCYHPLLSDGEVSPLPARRRGGVRFGCLNNLCKTGDRVIELWSRVMQQVPGSRFVLLAPPGRPRSRAVAAFEANGIDRDRVDFVDFQPRLPYLALYRDIDVCLDTFPYNGHTTSLDAFWMGVPVVTLVGPTVVGRAGLSQAQNLGLPELVARTPDAFVQIAVDLARDTDRLAALRAGLRARMEASPLMDAPRFAKNLEAAYRRAWQAYSRPSA